MVQLSSIEHLSKAKFHGFTPFCFCGNSETGRNRVYTDPKIRKVRETSPSCKNKLPRTSLPAKYVLFGALALQVRRITFSSLSRNYVTTRGFFSTGSSHVKFKFRKFFTYNFLRITLISLNGGLRTLVTSINFILKTFCYIKKFHQ